MTHQNINNIIYAESDTPFPTFTGSAFEEIGKPETFARLTIANNYYEIPVDPLTGFYSWTATRPLPDGDYSVAVSIRDNAGNVGQPSLYTLRIDTTPPEAPVLIKLYDDVGPEQHGFEPGDKTDDKRPTLTGIAQSGTTIFLLNDQGEKIGSAVADSVTGLWQMDPAQDLVEGSNSLRLVAEEVFAGKTRTGTPSSPFTIIIESSTLPPDTVTLTHAFDDVGSATGELSNGALTDDTRPELRGTASLGSAVTVYYRLVGSNVWLGTATASVSGENWSWTPGQALPVGHYEFQASIGNASSALFRLDIASSADIIARTRIDYVIDDMGTSRGQLGNGALTDDTTPTFIGSGEANSKVVVRLTRNGGLSATVVVDVDSAGYWSWTPSPPLATGQWSFQLQVAGHSEWSAPFTLDISSDASYLGASIEYAIDNVGPVTDILRNGSTTDDTTPTLQGRAEANSTVLLRYSIAGQNAVVLSLNADNNGNWSWTPPALAQGTWTFEVKRVDQGNWSSFTLNIETLLSIPVIDYLQDNVGPVTDNITNGGKTDDRTPTLHGTGTAGSVVTVLYSRSENGQFSFFGSAVVGHDGRWSWTTPTLNDNGNWYFRAFATRDGEVSGRSSGFVIDIDPTVDRKPTIDYAVDNVGPVRDDLLSGGSTDDRSPELHGSGPANSEVSLRVSGSAGSTIYVVKTDASGNWSWTPPAALSDGAWNFQVRSTSATGYGKKFALTIVSPTYSGIIDFEEGTPVGKPFSWGGLIAKAYEYENLTFKTYGASSDLKLVSTGFINDPDFGLKALKMSYADYIQLVPKQDANSSRYLKDFSFTFYNDQARDFRVSFNLNLRTDEGKSKIISFSTSFKSGITVFTADDMPEGSKLSPGDVIVNMDLHRKYAPSEITHNLPIYIDNISWVTKADAGKTSLFALEDDNVHSIAGIDSLVETSIIGNEIQLDTLQLNGQTQLLDLSTLLEHGKKDLFIEDGKTQLLVRGHEGDVVQLKDILPGGSDISEWQHQDGTITIAGVEYQVHIHDNAELLVQQGVKTELI